MTNIQLSLRHLRDLVTEIKQRPRPARKPGAFVTIRFNAIHVRRIWLDNENDPLTDLRAWPTK